MTLQELASLPKGTRVRLMLGDEYEYATIGLSGAITHVTWDDGPTSLIDAKSQVWSEFVGEMEVA